MSPFNILERELILMEKIVIDKKNYDKFAFKGPLAIEDYCDFNKINENQKKIVDDMYIQVRKYHEKQMEMIRERDELVKKLINTMESLGIDNFTIYDDGNITYND